LRKFEKALAKIKKVVHTKVLLGTSGSPGWVSRVPLRKLLIPCNVNNYDKAIFSRG
jgi:hypothetical protein